LKASGTLEMSSCCIVKVSPEIYMLKLNAKYVYLEVGPLEGDYIMSIEPSNS
jgi:hypothetical protein